MKARFHLTRTPLPKASVYGGSGKTIAFEAFCGETLKRQIKGVGAGTGDDEAEADDE